MGLLLRIEAINWGIRIAYLRLVLLEDMREGIYLGHCGLILNQLTERCMCWSGVCLSGLYKDLIGYYGQTHILVSKHTCIFSTTDMSKPLAHKPKKPKASRPKNLKPRDYEIDYMFEHIFQHINEQHEEVDRPPSELTSRDSEAWNFCFFESVHEFATNSGAPAPVSTYLQSLAGLFSITPKTVIPKTITSKTVIPETVAPIFSLSLRKLPVLDKPVIPEELYNLNHNVAKDVYLYMRFQHYVTVLKQCYYNDHVDQNPLKLVPAAQNGAAEAAERHQFLIRSFDTAKAVDDEVEATLAYRTLLAKKDPPETITSEMSVQHSTGWLVKFAFEITGLTRLLSDQSIEPYSPGMLQFARNHYGRADFQTLMRIGSSTKYSIVVLAAEAKKYSTGIGKGKGKGKKKGKGKRKAHSDTSETSATESTDDSGKGSPVTHESGLNRQTRAAIARTVMPTKARSATTTGGQSSAVDTSESASFKSQLQSAVLATLLHMLYLSSKLNRKQDGERLSSPDNVPIAENPEQFTVLGLYYDENSVVFYAHIPFVVSDGDANYQWGFAQIALGEVKIPDGKDDVKDTWNRVKLCASLLAFRNHGMKLSKWLSSPEHAEWHAELDSRWGKDLLRIGKEKAAERAANKKEAAAAKAQSASDSRVNRPAQGSRLRPSSAT
ncbi:hypothetical protein BDW22DRAFT_1418003 [Trametopsis cervina]|nr:hypothetical protein BDW22DRAFT_1418003 [Trametopsis cervina]